MALVRKLQNIGGSKAVILPKAFLVQLAIPDDGQVEVALARDHIVITPHRPAKPKLVAKGAR